jgi:hypothetical protein
MIPYDELDRALARWKARAQGGTLDASPGREQERGHDGYGSVPRVIAGGGVAGLPAPPEHTGEIDLEEAVVESYEDEP